MSRRTKPYILRDGTEVSMGQTVYHYNKWTSGKVREGVVHGIYRYGELNVRIPVEEYGSHWKSWNARFSCFSTREGAEEAKRKWEAQKAKWEIKK